MVMACKSASANNYKIISLQLIQSAMDSITQSQLVGFLLEPAH